MRFIHGHNEIMLKMAEIGVHVGHDYSIMPGLIPIPPLWYEMVLDIRLSDSDLLEARELQNNLAHRLGWYPSSPFWQSFWTGMTFKIRIRPER